MSDGSDSPCTAKFITGSCTHSNFMGDSNSFFQDGLFLQHLDFLTTRSASQASLPEILHRCQLPLGSTWQESALQTSLPVAAPTDLKTSQRHTAVQQVCISLRVRTSCQIFVINFLYCGLLYYLHGIWRTCRRGISLWYAKTKSYVSGTIGVRPTAEAFTLKVSNHLSQDLGNMGVLPA